MLRGATPSARAMPGTAVLRMVVSSACMKKATATSHGSSRREASSGTVVSAPGMAGSRRATIYCAPDPRAESIHVRQRFDGRHDRVSAEVGTNVAAALRGLHPRRRSHLHAAGGG